MNSRSLGNNHLKLEQLFAHKIHAITCIVVLYWAHRLLMHELYNLVYYFHNSSKDFLQMPSRNFPTSCLYDQTQVHSWIKKRCDKIKIVISMVALIVLISTISYRNLMFNLFNSCKRHYKKPAFFGETQVRERRAQSGERGAEFGERRAKNFGINFDINWMYYRGFRGYWQKHLLKKEPNSVEIYINQG